MSEFDWTIRNKVLEAVVREFTNSGSEDQVELLYKVFHDLINDPDADCAGDQSIFRHFIEKRKA